MMICSKYELRGRHSHVKMSDEDFYDMITKKEREMIKKNSILEECYVYDEFGNEIVHLNEKIHKDINGFISLKKCEDKIQDKRILIHTHPTDSDIGMGLSPADILCLNDYNLTEIRECDKIYWYSIKRNIHYHQKNMVEETINSEYEKLFSEYQDKFDEEEVKHGTIVANFKRACFVLQTLMKKYGYTFTAGKL